MTAHSDIRRRPTLGRRPRATAAVLAAAMAIITLSTVAATPTDAFGGSASTTDTVVAHWGTFFGNGSADNDKVSSPTSIVLPGKVVQVATSNSTQYALLANGSVYAWGLGGYGELGNGGTKDSFTVAVKVQFPKGVKIASLPVDAMPYDTGLAVDSTGQPWGWGLDSAGQLCLGNSAMHTKPVQIPLSKVTAMAGAGDHALYYSDGALYACGGNQNGDLGDGTTSPSDTPVVVTALAGRHVRDLVASYHDSGALLADGNYFDWGYDDQGQLGDGTIGVSSSVPVQVHLPLPVMQVVQGGSYSNNGQTLVMLSDGSLCSWGDNQFGQLGNGNKITQPSPIAFAPPTGVTYQSLASGGSTSYAISTSGDVYSWGDGINGQIGNGSTQTQLTPVMVETGASTISSTALDVATGLSPSSAS